MAISYVYRDVDLDISIGSFIIPPDSRLKQVLLGAGSK
jgi:hypothetical protein